MLPEPDEPELVDGVLDDEPEEVSVPELLPLGLLESLRVDRLQPVVPNESARAINAAAPVNESFFRFIVLSRGWVFVVSLTGSRWLGCLDAGTSIACLGAPSDSLSGRGSEARMDKPAIRIRRNSFGRA